METIIVFLLIVFWILCGIGSIVLISRCYRIENVPMSNSLIIFYWIGAMITGPFLLIAMILLVYVDEEDDEWKH